MRRYAIYDAKGKRIGGEYMSPMDAERALPPGERDQYKVLPVDREPLPASTILSRGIRGEA